MLEVIDLIFDHATLKNKICNMHSSVTNQIVELSIEKMLHNVSVIRAENIFFFGL